MLKPISKPVWRELPADASHYSHVLLSTYEKIFGWVTVTPVELIAQVHNTESTTAKMFKLHEMDKAKAWVEFQLFGGVSIDFEGLV